MPVTAKSQPLPPLGLMGLHMMPTPTLFACGHPNAGARGTNGECVHPDHYFSRG